MGEGTKIQWTDATWTIVQGCDYVSEGCANCYAVPLLHRMASNPNGKISLPLAGLVDDHGGRLRWTGKVACREDRLGWPLSWKKPRMVFVPSHGDLWHEDVPDEFLDCVFAAMHLADWHTYQVLTKRVQRMQDYMNDPERGRRVLQAARKLAKGRGVELMNKAAVVCWPLSCVWLGVSVENQRWADERVPSLLKSRAAIRFLSVEPLLGPINLSDYLRPLIDTGEDMPEAERVEWGLPARRPKVDWVIVGGESGRDARRCEEEWRLDIIRQCLPAGVAVFDKQAGSHVYRGGQRIHYRDPKGGDLDEWEPELRVRQFPQPRKAHENQHGG